MITKSYVYKVINKINGKIYIGKANDPENRWKKHQYIAKYKKKEYGFYYFHAAIIKYGKENFLFEIIEECDSEELALNREIYWVNHYKSNNREIGYNLTNGGEGVSGRRYTEEEKIIKSNFMRIFWQTHIHPCIGTHISSDHKKKISEANIGKHLDYNTKDKISQANSGEKNGNYGNIEDLLSRQNRGKKISETKRKNKYAPRIATIETRDKLQLAAKEKRSLRLSDEQKDEIIKLYNSGNFLKRELANQFNAEENTIVYIIRYWNKIKSNKLNKLSSEQKQQIIELYYSKLYTKKEISDIIKIPINRVISTIKMHIRAHKII